LDLIWTSYMLSKWRFSCSINGHIGPFNYVIEPRMGIIFKHVVRSFFKHISFGDYVLGVTPIHITFKYRCPIQTSNWVRHVYLRHCLTTLNMIFCVIWHVMSPWSLFGWHFLWISEQIFSWMSSSIGQNPTFSCQQFVMNYCHG